MKLPAGINKWGGAALGVVCLLLVVNLVAQYRDMQPGKTHPTPASNSPTRTAGKSSSHAADDLAKYDPTVRFDELKALDSRPLPDEDRNPFEAVGGGPVAVANPNTPPPQAAPPPPPPPPPLKAMGYNELPGGQKEAMISFNDDVVVAHEGDTIGTKYKVMKIDPAKVVIEDGDTHENFDLPFPP
ncbi:MAG: hypothetical protein ABSF71_01220 [Terriglobia bacterium]|jgi:hypothetical protein